MDSRVRELQERFERTLNDNDAVSLVQTLRRYYPEKPNDKATFEIALDANGKVNYEWHSRYENWGRKSFIKKPNWEFVDALRFQTISQSGSKTSRLILYSPTDNMLHEVFVRDSHKIISGMKYGWIVGRWSWLRRGPYYALKYLGEVK